MSTDLQHTALLSALNLLEVLGLEMTYEPETRMVYIYLDKNELCRKSDKCVEWHENVIADFSSDGKLLGIEIFLQAEKPE